MAKEIKVVINGEEFVSTAAKKAEEGMDGFFGKAKSWTSGFADLKAAWDLVSGAIARVGGAIVDSFAAYDELQTSQRKLEGTSRLTGLSLDYLRGIAESGRRTFGLSSVVANDYATEVSKLAVASGQAGKATDLLSAFLNVGAARGLSASQSLDAAKQAILGIDEGTDKLFGKNPSALWKDYEQVIGKSAGKFTDMDKQAALAWATLEAGNRTVGAYSGFLTSAQGEQAKLNDQLREMQARVGEAMQPARAFAIDVMSSLASNSAGGVSAIASLTLSLVDFLRAITPVLSPILAVGTALVEVLAAGASIVMMGIRALSYNTAIGVGNMLTSFGDLVEKGGRLLKVFGIDVVQSTGASLRQAGEAMRAENLHKLQLVELDYAKFADRSRQIVQRWKGETIATTKQMTDGVAAETAQLDQKANAGVEKAAANTRRIIETKLGPPLATLVGTTEAAITRLNTAASAQLPPERAKAFDGHMQSIAENARVITTQIEATSRETYLSEQRMRAMAEHVVGIARSALDAAQAFGVVDRDAASALNSVINIGQSIGKLASGDIAGGITGIVAGVANVVSLLVGGDAERRRLLRENNTQLGRLRDEIGNLSLNVTGDDFQKATNALQDIVPRLKGGAVNLPKDVNTLIAGLAKQGIGLDKLDKIADALGIQIRDKDGKLRLDMLPKLLEAIGLTEFGKFGDDYASQKQATEAGFDVNQTDDVGRIGALGALGGSFSSALRGIVDVSDLAGTRARLAALFARLNSGGVSASEMGGLTGTQFLELITNLIGRIDGLEDGASATAAPPPGATSGDTVSVPGVGSVPTSVVTDLGTLLTKQTDLLTTQHASAMVTWNVIADNTGRTADTLVQIDHRLARMESSVFDGLDRGLAARRQTALSNAGQGLTL